MSKYTALCLSDPHPDHVNDGSSERTLSAARFAGRYRLVDFMLSNMVNSGITDIGIILNSHYQSLIAHIGMGKEWDLARKAGGITFFPPYMTDARDSEYSAIDGPLQRAARALRGTKSEYVILVNGSAVYNMDYRPAIEAHKENGADVTAVYAKKEVNKDAGEQTVVFDITEDNRVRSIKTASRLSGTANVSLGAYIMPKHIFLQLVTGVKYCGMLRFSCERLAPAVSRLKVMGYEFTGYSAQISSVETDFRHNMEMLDSEKRAALFDYEGRRIFTSRRDSLPAKYGKAARVENSLVADGCQIEGTVINSVICRNVRIGPGAVVENCVLKDSTVIQQNAKLDWMITDRGVIVSAGRNLIGAPTYPVFIESERII
ncbi:MAG: glucose-1-phosphate adenylyltransferase subunit GlgD [Oscillospiraceae bacterium]|nr:glucose-1-phosphate adenylyltransferase subunit GlgD [Oscillospiraceae bacterium]